ncbi:unnamed protein product [Polarella glacialis]|uniref:protein-tyrosine-phosphatase n=1 Tax=Polarella glacialis TaxID=89957 RepID=A0A813L5P1_POLGL|nr:unnamed protein product [Polarella glacialis]
MCTASCLFDRIGPQAIETFGIDDEQMQVRLALVQRLVAQPIPETGFSDPSPASVEEDLFVGSKYHAADVEKLVSLGVTAVLNCAPSGITTLPLNAYQEKGIRYRFTNVRQDDYDYPILHDREGSWSAHLHVASTFYTEVRDAGGKALFFCVAGQNRSPTLALAVLLLRQKPLLAILEGCSKRRPFILENVGFQRQLVELESRVRLYHTFGGIEDSQKRQLMLPGNNLPKRPRNGNNGNMFAVGTVTVELLVPGLCTVDVLIPAEATIASTKDVLVKKVNGHLLSLSEGSGLAGKSWLVFSMFGTGTQFDLVLEEEAVETSVQVARLGSTFGLKVKEDGANSIVHWTGCCRFELVIFSLVKPASGSEEYPVHEVFTFRHQERAGAPGTLLENNVMDTHLRSWDFVSGQAFRSKQPIVFSYSEDERDKRDFMNVSTSHNARQQFSAPGEGGILGMGANAIVHHVELEAVAKNETLSPLCSSLRLSRSLSEDLSSVIDWDAAVKRPFSLSKMLASLRSKSEAGVAKRLRMAGALNKEGRLLYFYGLGLALSSNNGNHEQYKFEATLLSRYQEEFSAYTLKQFMDDYTTVLAHADVPADRSVEIRKLQEEFSLIKVKVLLVSLLNGFRDLTLMGVQAFDFCHMNNVLISRDYRKARIIDIDGESKGSIQFPSLYIQGISGGSDPLEFHKPALDIDLSTLLPVVVRQLILGKGRGKPFVDEQVSKIRRSHSEEDAKAIISSTIRENFCSSELAVHPEMETTVQKHILKLTEWFHAMLMKKSPWTNWTNDIYDAMRCIDHLPIG